jgi:hypothetical protein
MKSARAEELRLILPFALRLATADFFGTDDFRARVKVVFGFEVVRDLVPDEERDDREDDRPLFCAITCNGSRRAIAANATPIRLSMYTPSCGFGIIERSMAEAN